MLIVCPNCDTSYEVAASSLPPGGRSVRCARCKEVWFATAQAPAPEPAMAEDMDAAWGEALAESGPKASHAEPPPEPAEDDSDWAAALSEQEVDVPPVDTEDGIPGIDMSIDMPSGEAPSLVPDEAADPDLAAAPTAAPREDIESAARRVARDSRRKLIKILLPLAIVVLAGLNAGLLIWRAEVVRAVPQTASLYERLGLPVNLRGLEFANVTVTRDQHEGVSVLVVEGLILSVSKTPVEVPRLRLSILNDSGAEIYTWTTLPTRNILGAGEQLPFRSRLASPPADGRDVTVRFFNRKDLSTVTR